MKRAIKTILCIVILFILFYGIISLVYDINSKIKEKQYYDIMSKLSYTEAESCFDIIIIYEDFDEFINYISFSSFIEDLHSSNTIKIKRVIGYIEGQKEYYYDWIDDEFAEPEYHCYGFGN